MRMIIIPLMFKGIWHMKPSVIFVVLFAQVLAAVSLADNLPEYTLVLKNHVYHPSELKIPAGTKFKIIVRNEDATAEEFESTDFGREKILDADGEAIPSQDLYVVSLSNGYSFAARGSGTEPKMKFYLFAEEKVASAAELPAVKTRVKAELDRLNRLIEADANRRAGA